MHELIAVGIEHGVFDKTVAYGFWSGALVGHCAAAKKIIDFSRADPSDLSAYISLIDLNTRWKKRLDEWASKQPQQPPRPVVVPGPVILHFAGPRTVGAIGAPVLKFGNSACISWSLISLRYLDNLD